MLRRIDPFIYLRVDVISDVHVDDAQLLQLDVNDVTRSADEAQDGGRRGDGNNVIISPPAAYVARRPHCKAAPPLFCSTFFFVALLLWVKDDQNH